MGGGLGEGGAYGLAMGARARRESRVGSTPLGGRCKVIRKTGGKAWRACALLMSGVELREACG